MTATAFALSPDLDLFNDDGDGVVPQRPQLRLIDGGLTGQPTAAELRQLESSRMRRFIALVVLTAVVLLGAQLGGISLTSFGSAPAAIEPESTVHVVLPGDSYGSIASDLGATNAVETAQLLREANGGGELVIGQRLILDISAIDLPTG